MLSVSEFDPPCRPCTSAIDEACRTETKTECVCVSVCVCECLSVCVSPYQTNCIRKSLERAIYLINQFY